MNEADLDEFRIEFKKEVGTLFRSYRESANISVEELTEKLGEKQVEHLLRLENGVHPLDRNDLFEIIKLYQLNLVEIYWEMEKIRVKLNERGLKPKNNNPQ